MKSILLCIMLVAPFAARAAEPDQTPPLFYVLALSSQVTNADAMGLASGPTGDANRKATLLQPLACLGGKCRRIVDPPVAWDRDWFAKMLAQEPTQAGRLAFMYISFDGYYLTVIGDLQDAKLDAAGRVKYGKRISAHYGGVCSRPTRVEDTAKLRSEAPTTGVLGSFELQSEFLAWSGCTNERLLQELRRDLERIAELWEVRLAPASESALAAKLANRPKLPLVRDVIAQDGAACVSMYGDYAVIQEQGDHLWLSFPQPKLQGIDSILIAPRCNAPEQPSGS